MAGVPTLRGSLRLVPQRDYTAITNVESNHLTNTFLVRGAVVASVLGLAWIIGKSMVDDLLEEIAAGLT